jgi:hypothetical protein
MMASVPRCTECGKPLVYEDGSPKPAGTLTDTVACRSRRARRLKREEKARNDKRKMPPHTREVTDVVNGNVKDAAHEVLKEELRPIVREQMTENVLSGINQLIGLQATAIAALEADLKSQDEGIRQRAYTLLLKYTMGNPSVAPPSTQAAPAGLTVQFNLPRPGDDPTPEVATPSDAEELRTCDQCAGEKPVSQFVAGSSRCGVCHDGLRGLRTEKFGDAYVN